MYKYTWQHNPERDVILIKKTFYEILGGCQMEAVTDGGIITMYLECTFPETGMFKKEMFWACEIKAPIQLQEASGLQPLHPSSECPAGDDLWFDSLKSFPQHVSGLSKKMFTEHGVPHSNNK